MNVTWYISDDNRTNDDEIYDVSDSAVMSALVVVVWTMLANSIIVMCFIINRKTIWPTFSTQVLCLSVTDMVVGLASLPLTILPFLSSSLNYRYCSLLFLIFFASQCASLYQIFGICVHRCIVINQAFMISEQRSDFRFPLGLAFSSWILSIVVNVLLQILYGSPEVEIKQCQFSEIFTGNTRQAATFLFIIYFVPFFLTNILYIITCLRLRCIWKKVVPTQITEMNTTSNRISRLDPGALIQGNNIYNMSRDNSASRSRDNGTSMPRDNGASIIRTQQKVIRTIGSLMLIFNVCTIPLIVLFLIENQYQINRTFKFIVFAMFILNSAMNPFVYSLRTNWLRLALKQMFRDGFNNICPCKRSE